MSDKKMFEKIGTEPEYHCSFVFLKNSIEMKNLIKLLATLWTTAKKADIAYVK